MKSKKLLVLGSKISYFDNEIDSDITLLCIHGNSSSKNTFLNLINSFTDESIRVLAIDLFGHGESEVAQNPSLYSMRGYANLVKDFIENLELSNIVLLGHSLGGHIAIETIPMIEEKILSIVTWGTPPLSGVGDLAHAFSSHPALGVLFSKDVGSTESMDFIKSSVHSDFRNLELMSHSFDITDPNARHFLGVSLQSSEIKNEIKILEDFKKASLIIHGDFDLFISKDYLTNLAIKDKLNIVFENFSHCPHIDTPEQLFNEIKKFMFFKLNRDIFSSYVSKTDEAIHELS